MPELYPFQEEGVKFLLNTSGRAILADDMGLGKTPQVLRYMAEIVPPRTLVVAPASVVHKWKAEVHKWLNPHWTCEVVTTSKTALPYADILVISYALMARMKKALSSINFGLIVADESHSLKNYKTKRYKAFKQIIAGTKHVLFVSGTPFLNRPAELFNMLNIISRRDWPNRYKYWKRYCNLQEVNYGNGRVLDRSGSSNEEELAERLKAVMIRRTKQEVADQLPPITRSVVPVKMSSRQEYSRLMREKFDNPLVKLTKLRQVVGQEKIIPAISLAEDLLDQDDGHKLVMFAHHLNVVQQLTDKLSRFGVTTITGDVPQDERWRRIERFQNSPYPRIMVITTAGGEGIDLFRANHIIFTEREWTPAVEEQAEARLHRVGQSLPVTAWYLVAEDTIDEYVHRLIEEKRELFRTIVGADQHKTVIRELLEVIQ